MMDQRHYDVLIVGARVAGSILAALLGDAGIKVLLIDKAKFPSSTLSTHFFRGGGLVSILDKLGLLDDVLDLGSPKLTEEYQYLNSATPITNGPQNPGSKGYCLSVRREPLDNLLIKRACQSNHVTYWEATKFEALIKDGDRVLGASLVRNESPIDIRANITIGADGRNSLVAKQVNAKEERYDPAYRALYYCYVEDFAKPIESSAWGPEFSVQEDEMAYVFPSDAGTTCLALSINLVAFKQFKKEPQKAFVTFLNHHPSIGLRFKQAKKVSNIFGQGPTPNYMRLPFGPGWALIGDAAMYQDPWSGMGMDTASMHATYLADAIIPNCIKHFHKEAQAKPQAPFTISG
jgi:flavin-dependent dehydrogenase